MEVREEERCSQEPRSKKGAQDDANGLASAHLIDC